MEGHLENFEMYGGRTIYDVLASYIKDRKNDLVQSLLKIEKTHEISDDSGSTLLHRAAEYGNEVMVQYLIDSGCAVDVLNQSGKTPLMLALNSDSIPCIEILLKARADLYVCDADGKNVLQQAFQSSKSCMKGFVNRMTSNPDFYVRNNQDKEMLTKLVQLDLPRRSHDVICLFLNKVKEISGDDDRLLALTLIQVGCSLVQALNLRKPEVIKIMLEHGMQVNELDDDTQETPLHKAIELLDFELVKLLVLHGADVNAQGLDNQTPLCRYPVNIDDTSNGPEIFKFMIDNGASLKLFDSVYRTPMSYLLREGNQFLVRTVLQYVDDLSEKDRYDMTVLYHLANNRKPNVLEALRGKIFDQRAHYCQSMTPLLIAVRDSDLEKIKFWLEHGFDVNFQTPSDLCPLQILFLKNRIEPNFIDVIAYLLQHGADPQCSMRRSGSTLFDLAEQNDYVSRAKPLIAHLVIRENLGKIIETRIREKIKSNRIFKHHYELCQRQLEKLENTIVCGSITLMKLLIENEKKITLYARNPNFLSQFERRIADFGQLDAYFTTVLRKRVGDAVNLAKNQEKAAFAICKMTGLPFNASYRILYCILGYLKNEDLENVLQA